MNNIEEEVTFNFLLRRANRISWSFGTWHHIRRRVCRWEYCSAVLQVAKSTYITDELD